MGGLLGCFSVACLFLWYFCVVTSDVCSFFLITCYMPWTFRREHCPPCRNNTTGTPGAHREACGHGRGAVKTDRKSVVKGKIVDPVRPAIKQRKQRRLRSEPGEGDDSTSQADR